MLPVSPGIRMASARKGCGTGVDKRRDRLRNGGEPVSEAKFPASSENTGNFRYYVADTSSCAESEVRNRLVWGFSCQAVVFGFCCQFFVRSGKGRSSSRRLRSGSRRARKGSRDR